MGGEGNQLATFGRRHFISTTTRAAGALAFAPAVVRQDQSRPTIEYGTAAGDVTGSRAIVWSRSDRASRMLVEWSTTESFQNIQRARGSVARDATGLTARADLSGLPQGQRIFYRVLFQDLGDSRNVSLPASGNFLSAPAAVRDVTFAWSADTVGQGWGINLDWGGLKMFETMRRAQPDFFVHCGDTIYADSPLVESVKLPDGSIWKNLVTPAKSKVAQTLDEFRGQHLYNMLDENVRRFNAEVAQVVLWDDHEVRNNWYPQQTIESDDRYTIKSVAALSRNARRAFLEHVPIRVAGGERPPIYRTISYGPLLDLFTLDLRTYRGANSANRQTVAGADSALAGSAQIEWLKRALAASRATWKVIASDLPLALVVPDGASFEAFANGDGGAPRGRELEIADLLSHIHRRQIRNVVWITADVHYAAAHHYDPARAQFKDFAPFWEFVAGPIHAITGGVLPLDDTFGPESKFIGVPKEGSGTGPWAGFQFFGFVRINGSSRVMTVQLRNLAGETIYSAELVPEG